MADGAHDTTVSAQDTESQIKSAIFSRSSYFQEQADSLTFEKVRRLLEEDLGLETHALDTHKRFVKQWLKTCVESDSPDNLSKSQGDAEEKVVSSTEEAKSLDELQVKNEAEEPNSGGAETMEDSPVMGLMTGKKKEYPNDGVKDTESKRVPSESTIEKAIQARGSYIKENSANITLAGLRRLLEEDLEIEKHALDPFKKFISRQVDEVLNSLEVPQPTVSKEKKKPKKDNRKVSSKSSKEETPASSGNESDEVEEEEMKSAPKKRQKMPEVVKKRQRTEEKSNGAKRKQQKVSKSSKNVTREEEGGDVSGDDNNSDSSAEKTVKKKDIPKPLYGKEVERLKSVIRSCGMSISPAVYRKAKQAPENKREACLIKELEGILSKEGLSPNPSEKEIKDVKKRKERAKELEGIDLSNIVQSSRRRSTASFIPPPKPIIPDLSESESEESEDEDDEEDEDDDVEGDEEVENEDANEDQEEENAEEDQEDGGNSSQNEESEKGNSDDE